MALGSGLMTNQRARLAHLVRGKGGVPGEIKDLRDDITDEMSAMPAIAMEELSNIAVADVDAIKASIASSASIATYSGSDLDGAIGAGVMSPPRNITITTTSDTDIDAVAVVITGTDVDGAAQTDTITLTNDGNTTDIGTIAFATVTQIVIPAQTGTGGALEFGFGNVVGLAKPIVARAGLSSLMREIVSGVALDAVVYEEWPNLATADVDAIKTTIASSASIETYSGSDLDGTIGEDAISPPRNITITTSNNADINAVDVVITGTDIHGNVITDTITLTDDGNTTDAGVVAFATVTQIVVPANAGTGATLDFGTGVIVGFAAPLKVRNSDAVVLAENEAGTPKAYDALAGTYVAPSAGDLNGNVTQGSAPNGTNDYAYAYEPVKGTIVDAATSSPNGTYAPPVNPGGGMDVAIQYEYDPTV